LGGILFGFASGENNHDNSSYESNGAKQHPHTPNPGYSLSSSGSSQEDKPSDTDA
jgi:hypothetical protein